MNVFLKHCGYWYYLLADKYELSARLLLYTWHSIHQDASDHKYLKRHEQTRQRNIAPRHPHSVEFSSDDPYHSFPLSIKCIHCVIREEEYLYILCYSGNLHILGIHERGHILIPIEEQLNLPELFYWTCYSWWNLLRIKRTGKQQSEDFTD